MRIRDNKGFTLIELLIVVAIIGIIAAIAVPGLLRARISGNEASAIGSLRAIVSAQADYQGLNKNYATSLEVLSALCPGMTVPFISPDLDTNGVEKSGFNFLVQAGATADTTSPDCNATPTASTFYAEAAPVTVQATGNRSFASDHRSAIYQDSSGNTPFTEPLAAAGTVTLLGR